MKKFAWDKAMCRTHWFFNSYRFLQVKKTVNNYIMTYCSLQYYVFQYVCNTSTVSLTLKLHSERTAVTRATSRIWYDRFIVFHPRIILTDTVLRDIASGLEFGKLIDLPEESSFSFQLMTDLAVSEKCIRPFRHIRYVLQQLYCNILYINPEMTQCLQIQMQYMVAEEI